MTDLEARADRLRRAFSEFQDGGLRVAEAAERWGWNANTLKSNLSGVRKFSFDKAEMYAKRLKVSAEWLYFGAQPMRPDLRRRAQGPIEVPVVEWLSVGVHSGVATDLDAVDTITTDGLPAGTYVATDVVDDSMNRISPTGSRIIFNTEDKRPQSGSFYIVVVRGKMTFKRFQADPVPRLEPYSTNPEHPMIFLSENAWEIVGKVVRTIKDL